MSSMVSRIISPGSSSSTALAAVGGGAAMVLIALGATQQLVSSSTEEAASSSSSDRNLPAYRIESDLMDRIASKPYLQSTRKTIPKRLRILAIDVPEMRHAFDGECRLNLSKVYDIGVAPPKVLHSHEKRHHQHHHHHQRIQVAQKSLAKSIIKCRKNKRIGVELLEASVADLNPHNLRRTHQFGSYRYDPGKYSAVPNSEQQRQQQPKQSEEDEKEIKSSSDTNESNGDDDETFEQDKPKTRHRDQGTMIQKDKDGNTAAATEEDEIDAPWNQYAWIEEMQLRISGRVAFGEILKPSSSFSRLLYGHVYKTTIPSALSTWESLFVPSMFHRNPDGQDGNNPHHRNSQKPHAVIADGAAMQRVPGSMRFLQRTCQDAGVALFIVNDPRVWGGNTHQDLTEALVDMRKTVKYQVVQQAMRGSTFARGRLLGQIETEAKWQAKELGEKTRAAVRQANQTLQRERRSDWSQLSSKELMAKLIQHKVITKAKKHEAAEYSQGMVELARQCAKESETRDQDKEKGDATDIIKTHPTSEVVVQ